MKSLKRTLSLVLALVMVLGLFGGISMTASASDFTDDESIQYKEAVDVMTAIGAINGIGDGTFQPKGSIRRADAAKLITYTILGKDAAERLPSGVTSRYSDVDANWAYAAPSIEYLANAGVIDGMGDGTFHPADPIEGYAVLKMLLCAIGYGAKSEYVGDSWKLNVAIDASREDVSLTKGLASGVTQGSAATREEVALYCLNAILADKVRYLSALDTYIKDTGALGGGYVDTIKLSVYPELALQSPDFGGATATGDPANVWKYKGVEIGRYPVKTALSYNTALTKTALTSALKDFTVDGSVVITLNGDPRYSATTISDLVAKLQPLTGNGTLVNVYANNMGKLEKVTVVKNDVAEVASVNKTTGVKLNVISKTQAVGKANYTITPQDDLYASVSGLEKDDIVVVTPVWSDAADAYVAGYVAVPTAVTGELSALGGTDATKATVTVNGEKYPVAAAATTAMIDKALSTVSNKGEVTLYVDALGNAVHVDSPAVADNYMYLVSIHQTLDSNGVMVNIFTGYNTNGELITLNVGNRVVTSFEPKDLLKYEPSDAADAAAWHSEYKPTELVQIANSDANGDAGRAGKFAPSQNPINSYDLKFEGAKSDSGTRFALYTADVKFIFVNASGIATVKEGVQKVATAADARAIFSYDATDGLLVKTVFVTGDPVGVGTNILYLKTLKGSENIDGKPMYYFDAVINGETVSISTRVKETPGEFFLYGKDEKDVYTLAEYGTAGEETGVANSTQLNQTFTSLEAGHILTTADLNKPLDAGKAEVVDLVNSGITSLTELKAAVDAQKNVKMALIYDDLANSPTQNSIKYIYITSVDWITISAQPQDAVAKAGYTAGSVSFSVTASAASGKTLTYQWQKSNNGTSGWADCGNAQGDGHDGPVFSPAKGITGVRYYQCIITCGDTTATSNVATFTVTAP